MKRVSLLDAADLVADRVEPFVGSRPYIATSGLDDTGALRSVAVTFEDRPTRADLEVQSGDVCFARMKNTRKVRRFESFEEHYILSTGFAILRPKEDIVDPTYLQYWLRSDEFQQAKNRACTGAVQPAITNRGVGTLEIPLPPIGEQRRTAAVLQAADAIRGKRRDAVSALEALTEAIFIDRFITAESAEWDLVRIESIAARRKGSIRTGPFGSDLLHDEFVEEGVAVLGIDNAVQNRFVWDERRFITQEKFLQLERFQVFPGDVLVTIMATCGRVALVPDDIPLAINTKHLCCITTDKQRCLPEFLWACLRFHPRVLHQLGATHGAVMPGLNMGRIKETEIPLPPLTEQQLFTDQLHATEHILASAEASLHSLDDLFSSLQLQAFRGGL